MNQIQKLSTKDLIDIIDRKSLCLVDIRPVDAYNGWAINSEARGGHIKGARSLPFKWTNYIDWIEIVRSKGISLDNEVVIYGYSVPDIYSVAKRFQLSGYTDIKVYCDFVSEWSASDTLAMEKLERYNMLIYPDWLDMLLQGKKPPEYNNTRYVVCHGHYQNRSDYEEGHIPGAFELDTNTLESPETWNRRSPEELKKRLEELGITADTTVILYGRFSYPNNKDPFPGSSAGHLGSIRAAFILLYAGVRDVRILNGGLQSWADEGYSVTSEDTFPTPVLDCGLNIPERPHLAVDIPEAKEMIKSDNAELVCVRSWSEYIGEESGYNYIEKKGRIPGAVFGDCGTDAYHMENYRNLDHTCKEFHEIESAWRRVGIVPEKHNAFYCGTGWRGSEAWLNAYLMGWPRVSVFDGGWFEWSNDPDNQYETGVPEILNDSL